MMKFYKLLGLAAVVLLFVTQAEAKVVEKQTPHLDISVITATDQISPSTPLDVLIKFKMKKGWHIFSENPGDIGLPTKVEWKLPLSYELKDTRWSNDKKFVNEGIIQYGYDKTAYYKATIIPSDDVMKEAKLEAQVSWLACKDECVPGKTNFVLNLPIIHQDLQPGETWLKASKLAQASFEVAESKDAEKNLLVVLFMAFMGGIVLNFMPCIFPILTIKAISLAQSPYNRKKSQIESMLYLTGVVFSFLAIATILVLLREKGEQIGWGFQLQSPIFVTVMIVIFSLVFLMLLDLVTIKNPLINRVGRISFTRRKINAFMTGFFAVLIASPCTAPFMGIAIGYTLSKPIYIYYPVFLALSLGYALPFTLAGLFPRTIHKILPKPGRWMDVLKKIFAIPVFLTVVWLIWVLSSQVRVGTKIPTTAMDWQEYDAKEVAQLVEQNKPVFIDFTAKWCITCLVNKKVALQSNAFAELVKSKNIYLFRADWTNDDVAISTALERYGRNSIPLYVYYDGKSKEFVLLPQLLTPNTIREYLK